MFEAHDDNVAFALEVSRLVVRIQFMIYNTRFMGYVRSNHFDVGKNGHFLLLTLAIDVINEV